MTDQVFFKNLDKATSLDLGSLVEYDEGSVVSRTIAQKGNASVTLFAFDEGEGLDAHTAPGDAMVFILDGEALVTIDGTDHVVGEGKSIVMPANVPHGLKAEKKFKMMLIIIK